MSSFVGARKLRNNIEPLMGVEPIKIHTSVRCYNYRYPGDELIIG